MSEDKLNELHNLKINKEKNKIMIETSPADIRDVSRFIIEKMGVKHLTAITGIDEGEKICIIYHFWSEGNFINIVTRLLKTELKIESITDIVPGALLYEAEVHDMLGVFFHGNPLMGTHLLLPDTYPEDIPPPLRKEITPEEIRRRMLLE